MRWPLSLIAVGFVICASGVAGEKPAAFEAYITAEIPWESVTDPANAHHAVLWNSSRSVDAGLLMRWPARAALQDQVNDHEVRFLVLAGTFVVETEGKIAELGPSGFASISPGIRHSIRCEASGMCVVLVHAGVDSKER